jgi:hypothetical protein
MPIPSYLPVFCCPRNSRWRINYEVPGYTDKKTHLTANPPDSVLINQCVAASSILIYFRKFISRYWMWGRSRGSSVSIVTDYGLDDRGSIPDRGRGFFFLVSASRPALGSTQPPIQWVPGVLSPVVKRGRGVMLTTHPHLVPRLCKSRSYTSSPPMCLHGWHVAGQLYFTECEVCFTLVSLPHLPVGLVLC